MLTDSGGYQIFSMGFGSVSNEIKGKRDAGSMGWNQSLISIDENGASFRSYVDGLVYDLTPEKSIEIQRKLGADLIVVLDECTPFNVDKHYTAYSTRRSHRWALRSLEEFKRTASGKQALYGIIQGGVYEDLRIESANFINDHGFFGTAIGGSLGDTRRTMHDIVAFTRRHVRNDRPVHLLGIGGVRDIFHGVRQGIDTFDCVHPSRLGRHGGALVPAAHWAEEPLPEQASTPMTVARERRQEKMRIKEAERRASARQALSKMGIDEPLPSQEQDGALFQSVFLSDMTPADAEQPNSSTSTSDDPSPVADDPSPLADDPSPVADGPSPVADGSTHTKQRPLTVREHIDVTKSRMRMDPRPIDSSCGCYTCRNFSRAYLHHLFKAKETLGGTLVTIHNVHFMNRLMKAIREAIASGKGLNEVEQYFVHPSLLLSDSQSSESTNMGS